LFERLTELTIESSRIAMHLDRDWRDGLFKQLSLTMLPDEWDEDDQLPLVRSFQTFLRATVFWRFVERPGTAISAEGNFIASWTKEGERVTLEWLPDDQVRWVVSRPLGELRESAAGRTDVRRLKSVLSPYEVAGWIFRG
jgi:hypothetical protein